MKCPSCGHETQRAYCSICGTPVQFYDDSPKQRHVVMPPVERHADSAFLIVTLSLLFIGLLTILTLQQQRALADIEARNLKLEALAEESQRLIADEQQFAAALEAKARLVAARERLEEERHKSQLERYEIELRLQTSEWERLEMARQLQLATGVVAIDADKDGLSESEERLLGTLPYDADTDNDGLLDGEDPTPTGGGRILTIGVAGHQVRVHSDLFDYYRSKPRSASWGEYLHTDKEYIITLAHDIVADATEEGVSSLEAIIRFIHDLSYVRDVNLGYDEYPKYPIETLVEGTGDCEDTSILMASLLSAINLEPVLLLSKDHMAVGIPCESTEGSVLYEGRRYCYLETTGPHDWQPGEVPEEIHLNDFHIEYFS
ncbi:hypothetical protein D6789_03695 [Candidatus Woesearchaeota archaeon]|nr:MAG: hypothetical protein D6789_03695 [Candidatus Woesearchaeota archaeon]